VRDGGDRMGGDMGIEGEAITPGSAVDDTAVGPGVGEGPNKANREDI